MPDKYNITYSKGTKGANKHNEVKEITISV